MRDNSELTLRKQKDFSRVYNKGKSRGSKYVVVLYRNNNLDYSRTAFVSSKKVGNSVERNRSRRLMRESYYSIRNYIKEGYDIVFVARNTIKVRAYQLAISPYIGAHCRYTPTCSAYFIEAVEKYGALKGSWLGIRRILRCHPGRPGGYDPVP